MSSLNCVKSQVPSSLSLQSVGVRPAEYEPGLAALTVRAGRGAAGAGPVRAEVRVVHGGDDVHKAVKAAVEECFGSGGSADDEPDNLGYWAIRMDNTLMVEKDRNKFLLALFSHITKESWDVISSCNLTPTVETDQICELFTWFVKRNVNTPPSSDCCLIAFGKDVIDILGQGGESLAPVNNTVKHAIDASEDKPIKTKVSESGYISEEDKKDSKDSSTEKINEDSPNDELKASVDNVSKLNSDNHGDETKPPIVDVKADKETKKDEDKEKGAKEETVTPASPCKSPDMLEEIDKEIRSSMENLIEKEDDVPKCETPTVRVAEIIKATEKQSPSKSKVISPKKNLEVQKNKSLIANLFGTRPISPNVAKIPQDDPQCPANFNLAGTKLLKNSDFLVDLYHQLFCRQWKLVTSVKTEDSCLTFFRHDPRILPGLGQQALSGFSVDSSGSVNLHNASNEIVENVKLFADEIQIGSKSCEFKLKDEPGFTKGKDLLTETVTIFNNYQFNIYATIELELNDLHTNLLLFKPSNVQATNILGLSLGHGNILTLTGGGQEEIDILRETLLNRWPYPIVSDMAVSASSWSWKVKRYPWRMSYGSKMVDRAVDRASKLVRQLSFPPPNNNDLESAKSLVVFIMKELAEKSWKFIGSNNLSSSDCLLHFTR
eukprot:TRINITY_DN1911_c0_g1_i1.p1 TRINITY_DN1911_c0_g1~~TRINITY_DN1911_c0_g1_i1.p1  ORF type:complete len:662 (-),score=158.21 TRINITY_DN1911_c0_g1_i1:592-2577(-)